MVDWIFLITTLLSRLLALHLTILLVLARQFVALLLRLLSLVWALLILWVVDNKN
ncbi:hypothetical protein [Circoviridae sp.]|nr:hypothetical protein [Circoviridae sp.]